MRKILGLGEVWGEAVIGDWFARGGDGYPPTWMGSSVAVKTEH